MWLLTIRLRWCFFQHEYLNNFSEQNSLFSWYILEFSVIINHPQEPPSINPVKGDFSLIWNIHGLHGVSAPCFNHPYIGTCTGGAATICSITCTHGRAKREHGKVLTGWSIFCSLCTSESNLHVHAFRQGVEKHNFAICLDKESIEYLWTALMATIDSSPPSCTRHIT